MPPMTPAIDAIRKGCPTPTIVEIPRVVTSPFPIWTVDQLLSQPPREYIVDPWLPQRSLVVAFGAPASGKSLLALTLARAIATGTSFGGIPTKPGRVAYVAAEASEDLGPRLKALITPDARASLSENLRFVPAAPQLHRDGLQGLLTTLRLHGDAWALIIIDTLARCFVSGDENSAQEMGEFVAACEELRDALSASVLLLHHANRGGFDERGSNALRGAADVMWRVSLKTRRVTVQCVKHRSAAPPKAMSLELASIEVASAGDGPTSTTVRLLMPDACDGSGACLNGFPRSVLTVSRCLISVQDSRPMTAATLASATGSTRSSTYRAIKWLCEERYAESHGDHRGARIVASPTLLALASHLSHCVPKSVATPGSSESHRPTPLKGGDGDESSAGRRDVERQAPVERVAAQSPLKRGAAPAAGTREPSRPSRARRHKSAKAVMTQVSCDDTSPPTPATGATP